MESNLKVAMDPLLGTSGSSNNESISWNRSLAINNPSKDDMDEVGGSERDVEAKIAEFHLAHKFLSERLSLLFGIFLIFFVFVVGDLIIVARWYSISLSLTNTDFPQCVIKAFPLDLPFVCDGSRVIYFNASLNVPYIMECPSGVLQTAKFVQMTNWWFAVVRIAMSIAALPLFFSVTKYLKFNIFSQTVVPSRAKCVWLNVIFILCLAGLYLFILIVVYIVSDRSYCPVKTDNMNPLRQIEAVFAVVASMMFIPVIGSLRPMIRTYVASKELALDQRWVKQITQSEFFQVNLKGRLVTSLKRCT